MGRNKRKHRHLPPRMRFAHGAYFYVDARGGTRPWVRLSANYADAIVRYAQREATATNRRDFNALADKYLAEAEIAESTRSVYRSNLKNVRKVFGAMQPADIEQIDAYRYLDERKKTVARQEVAVLSSVLTFGVKKGWLKVNPLIGMELPAVKRRKNTIDAATMSAILAKAEPEVALAVRFMHYTALRVSDALRVRWKDWRDDGLHVVVSKTKSPLHFERTPGLDALRSELKQRRIASLYAVADRAGRAWTYKRFYSAWLKVAPEDCNIHDLRRTRLTELARERGVEFAQSVAAHTDPKMTATYVVGEAKVRL